MLKLIKFLKFLIVCHLVVLQVSSAEMHSRNIRDRPIRIKKVPFIVRVLYKNEYICAGTAITRRFVVTTAYCVKWKERSEFTVVAGVTYAYQKGVRSKITANMINSVVDLAVLKLSSQLYGARIHPIVLCRINWSPGTYIKIYGWDKESKAALSSSYYLKRAKVQVMEQDKCIDIYKNRTVLTNKIFCASKPRQKDVFLGDSGSPAIINGQFCGITSWSIGCANHNFPSVFINVRKVISTIRSAKRILNSLGRPKTKAYS